MKILFVILAVVVIVLIISFLPKPIKKEAMEKKEITPTSYSSVFIDGIDSIQTSNYANPTLKYYYYIPTSIINNVNQSYPMLVMIPYLSGLGQSFVSPIFKEFANNEGFVIVSPSFKYDEKNWESRTSYQYPEVWSGNTLLEIIGKVKNKFNLQISGLYLFGFSAGAQFSLRFCHWQPELCVACAAHGSGGTILPDKKVSVKFFVSVGSRDTSRIEKAKAFFDSAQKLGIDVTYQEYNTAHSMTQDEIKDALDFFKSLK